ncbi:zinc finger X-linked protein ZXDB-like [Amphibalanus amphitrite]|uniref:zinc finger X-linked protein ZXDB-like n=1 Tax=Amphibalanus amphitrite TaxID=1232801 RepID=UPI001C904EE9|nr:zinc finger X-linked protein ZXDB-like [Amphibalanus amphitrite]XP_043192100.1 zinc finger X-linked protein ZXDB-like [Amphibalanus amphitrite]
MDPLLGPARSEMDQLPSELAGSSGSSGTQAADGSAQTILDAWLQQLQADQTEEPVVESRLDIDSLFSSELEFDLDFLTELSSLKGASSGDGGVSLQELSQDLELGFLCPPDAPLEPDPVDLSALAGAELFGEQPPAPATQPQPSEAAVAPPEPPRPPPVASISVVTNKQQGRTVITISTPRGRQSFVLPTADLTQASRVLRALQQKRRRSRAAAAVAAAATTPVPEIKTEGGLEEGEEKCATLSPKGASKRSAETAPGKRRKSHSDSKDAAEDDPVMSEAMRHLGIDLAALEASRDEKTKAMTCPEPGCQVATVNVFKLKVHILQHRNYKPYKCKEEGCKWEFFERGKLNRHEATHTQASLKCGEPGCPAVFRTRTNLMRHRLRIHDLTSLPPPPTPNPVAGFTDDAEHDDPPPSVALYRCPHCERVFRMAAGLKRHLDWHEKQSESACTYPGCGFTAPGLQQLRAHERRHAVKQYRCTHPSCSWAFESNAKLKRHLSQHTGRRNYRCPYVGCEKSYRRMEYLSGHIRLHLGRYYQCPQKGCQLRFTQQFSLATHIRSAHDLTALVADSASPGAAFVSCPMCEARFKSEIYREIHLQDVHGTSSSKLLQPQSSTREEDEADIRKKKSKFNPESLNWVDEGEPIRVDGDPDAEQTYTVYVPFEVETDSGPSEVLVKCDVTEEECRRLGIELSSETGTGTDQSPAAYDHVLAETNTAKDTARELRRMGVGVLSAGLRRTAQSGCARTDITSCHLTVRRSRPRPRRPPAGRQRRPGGYSRILGTMADPSEAFSQPYEPGLLSVETVLEEEPSLLLCDSDLLGSTINLSDLT